MKIYVKILLTILPLTFLNFAAAVGTTYYFSQTAILELAETWLTTKLEEAKKIADSQERLLHTYSLEEIPASITKAKFDAGTAIAQIGVGKSGYIFAVDSDGVISMHPDQDKLRENISATELFKRIKRGDIGSGLSFFNEGEDSIAKYSNYQPWGWTLVVVAPKREVFQVINRMKPFLVTLGLIGSFLVALIMTIVTRRITEPLRSLTNGVEEIRKEDFATRIPVHAMDEIGKLSLGFNEMARQLDNSHHELEQRVVERTKELTRVNEDLLQNINEKNRAVEALKIHERRMEAILKASPMGIGLVVDRKLGWANDGMYTLVGYDRDTLLNQRSKILYSSEKEYERVGRLLYGKISSGEIAKVETQWVRRDGAIIDCIIRACPLDSADLSKGLIVAVVDTTATKKMEANLQRAKKMEAIGTLAGGVAHDLNNILSGIVSYPELLLLDLPDDSTLRKPLETIKESGTRATIIVQDLLTMARRGVAVTEIVNLNTIIKEQLEGPELKQLMDYYPGIQVNELLDRQLSNLRGSKAHLAKSIMNLLSNAAEAMEAGGQIRISTKNVVLESEYRGYEIINKGRYAVITVEDDGVGIVEADLERIFEPFYTKKKMGRSGTGLGMAVVWGTVKDHDGFIDVQSIENMGTTFRLYFPIADEDETVERPPDSIGMFKGSGEKIMVVDDSELQREIAEKILLKLDYEPATAASGEEAVVYIEKNDVDLLILDMIMPNGMDGLETYKKIIELKSEQKVVIASGFSETDRVKEVQRLSGGQYLKKPYTIERLGKVVQKELSRI